MKETPKPQSFVEKPPAFIAEKNGAATTPQTARELSRPSFTQRFVKGVGVVGLSTVLGAVALKHLESQGLIEGFGTDKAPAAKTKVVQSPYAKHSSAPVPMQEGERIPRAEVVEENTQADDVLPGYKELHPEKFNTAETAVPPETPDAEIPLEPADDISFETLKSWEQLFSCGFLKDVQKKDVYMVTIRDNKDKDKLPQQYIANGVALERTARFVAQFPPEQRAKAYEEALLQAPQFGSAFVKRATQEDFRRFDAGGTQSQVEGTFKTLSGE